MDAPIVLALILSAAAPLRDYCGRAYSYRRSMCAGGGAGSRGGSDSVWRRRRLGLGK
jgi:hypothetical protein